MHMWLSRIACLYLSLATVKELKPSWSDAGTPTEERCASILFHQ